VHAVDVPPFALERLEPAVGGEVFATLQHASAEMRERYAQRVIWNVSSTERGGGVAEMLTQLIAYARGAGVDTRWMVIDGDPEFFALTKRIHNRLHGDRGDGGTLDREVYERTLARNELPVGPRDVVLLHDPQTLGLAPALKRLGATVVWRCHIGVNEPNDLARATWDFLLPYAREADVCVFSRAQYAWDGLERIAVIAPALDPASPKNQPLGDATVQAILAQAGLISAPLTAAPAFQRDDGSLGVVARAVEMAGPPPPVDAKLVVQISRWDALKDHAGVMRAFAEHVADGHLMLAGPSTEAVRDDPEGAAVHAACVEQQAALPDGARERVHLAALPMEDAQENAAIVNALQRHATVVAQKSLAEGFGLTVSEAMWKGRAVVGSRVGGIEDQIGDCGVLVAPDDLAAFAAAVTELLADPSRARVLGVRARERVRERFLAPRQLLDYARLLGRYD
jgi:trehalose synthase